DEAAQQERAEAERRGRFDQGADASQADVVLEHRDAIEAAQVRRADQPDEAVLQAAQDGLAQGDPANQAQPGAVEGGAEPGWVARRVSDADAAQVERDVEDGLGLQDAFDARQVVAPPERGPTGEAALPAELAGGKPTPAAGVGLAPLPGAEHRGGGEAEAVL